MSEIAVVKRTFPGNIALNDYEVDEEGWGIVALQKPKDAYIKFNERYNPPIPLMDIERTKRFFFRRFYLTTPGKITDPDIELLIIKDPDVEIDADANYRRIIPQVMNILLGTMRSAVDFDYLFLTVAGAPYTITYPWPYAAIASFTPFSSVSGWKLTAYLVNLDNPVDSTQAIPKELPQDLLVLQAEIRLWCWKLYVEVIDPATASDLKLLVEYIPFVFK